MFGGIKSTVKRLIKWSDKLVGKDCRHPTFHSQDIPDSQTRDTADPAT